MRDKKHGDKVKQNIYSFIVDYFKKNGYSPTVREIGEAVKLKSTSSVFNYLSLLVNEGKIEMRGGNAPRTIRLIGYDFVKQAINDEKICCENLKEE